MLVQHSSLNFDVHFQFSSINTEQNKFTLGIRELITSQSVNILHKYPDPSNKDYF